MGNKVNRLAGLFASALVVAMAISSASAADLPADCSQAAIPDQPVKGKIGDKDFTPDTVTFSTINHPGIGGATYDAFDVYMRGKDQTGGDLLLVINTIVPENALPDGQTFLLLPTSDATKQPTVGPGAAGIQGWMVEDDAAGLNVDSSTGTASLNLQFGTRANDTLTGKVYFCAPGAKDSFVAGTFKIDVSSQ
jgi:opacity protein-like surface antigen